MPRLATALMLVLLIGLGACGDEDNPIMGTWQGTINVEQQRLLEMDSPDGSDRLELVFTEKTATVNGEKFDVKYRKNEAHYFINLEGTNLTLSIIYLEDGTQIWRVPRKIGRGVVDIPVKQVEQKTGS